jgi:hypothetical protein
LGAGEQKSSGLFGTDAKLASITSRREPLMKNWVAARSDGRLERIEGLE